jgi:hypothetical protein
MKLLSSSWDLEDTIVDSIGVEQRLILRMRAVLLQESFENHPWLFPRREIQSARRDTRTGGLAVDPLQEAGQDAAGADLVEGVEAVGEHPPQ